MRADGAGKLAIVPLLAIAVALGATGIHGRRTHDPVRAGRALDLLAPTNEPRVATSQLASFFESGWVGWDVKTAVEIACGSTHAARIADPIGCLIKARAIVTAHENGEQHRYRSYTWLAWGAVLPLVTVVVLGASMLAGSLRRRSRTRARTGGASP